MPIGKIGGFNERKIAGSTRWSQHAYGNAIDLGSQTGRDMIDPATRAWMETHKEEWDETVAKWGMIDGGKWSDPDAGHIEWGGVRPWQSVSDNSSPALTPPTKIDDRQKPVTPTRTWQNDTIDHVVESKKQTTASQPVVAVVTPPTKQRTNDRTPNTHDRINMSAGSLPEWANSLTA
jgi:hypothetical protein